MRRSRLEEVREIISVKVAEIMGGKVGKIMTERVRRG